MQGGRLLPQIASLVASKNYIHTHFLGQSERKAKNLWSRRRTSRPNRDYEDPLLYVFVFVQYVSTKIHYYIGVIQKWDS